ncbi:DUF3888 domain-containing protein [Hazenella coriacea]|uniref:Uncharacterized protein DUF3888 n=1 Tax=Hazenella coriacea TaxID=1179467 RepID=A0A4V2UV10_9BACL|nr:DUF3888 domain-containing protein [Hazenella coriacea]TCS93937.1 uncharacterized protein DUF3888 [Hazenella coriacea]
MKNKFAICALSFLIFFFTTGYSFANQTPVPENLRDRALIEAMGPYIYSAITGYYGKTKLYDSEKILSVEQDPSGRNDYTVKIQVISFEGPHNPPYGLETVTLRISSYGVTVIDFKHKDYTPKPQRGFGGGHSSYIEMKMSLLGTY